MGQTLTLTAADGHRFSAYRADPPGAARGGVVVIQEIFGVNGHMRRVCDDFAREGFAALAPALFDRARPGVELGYGEKDIAAGRELRAKVSWDHALLDVAAAAKALSAHKRLGVVGYCWGGSVAWRAATQLPGFSASVCYYGGQVADFAEEKPRCPVLLHFGEKDAGIPMTAVEKLRAAQKANPAVEIQVYPAGHGFNCDERGSYDADSAKLARSRTLEFFHKHVG